VDLTEIRKIMKLMDEHGLSQFQYEKEDFNLKLKKGTDLEEIQKLIASVPSSGGHVPAPAPVSVEAPASAGAAPASAADGGAADAPSGEAISSPMVGTFYRKPSPDDPDFVNVGDTISEGQTLCIIEAMKVMNEIKAERSGTITQICVDDGTPVQFGDELFRVQ
jgi:acetyl-CoA carboxylase biotin carboxyl carrier protein